MTDTILSPSGPPILPTPCEAFFPFLIKKSFRFGLLRVKQLISALLHIEITAQPTMAPSVLWLDFHFATSLAEDEVTSHLPFRTFLRDFVFWF